MDNEQEIRNNIREVRLGKFCRILSNRYNLKVILKRYKTSYGLTDSNKFVCIKPTIVDDVVKNLICQKAICLHEIGHVMYTRNKIWNGEDFEKSQYIDRELINIIEDGRVEERISRKFPKARLYLCMLNQEILKFDAEKYSENIVLYGVSK